MSEKERTHNQGPEFNKEALGAQAKEHQEHLRETRERAAEKSHEATVEDARHEVKRATHERETVKHENNKEKLSAERRGPASKRERQASYDKTMTEVQSQMSGTSRAFSKVIHNPVIEQVSDVVGGTVARPNAILSGAVFAFLFTLVIYLIARFNGYPLSGTETIASFIAGWLLGLVLDYFRLLIFGKK